MKVRTSRPAATSTRGTVIAAIDEEESCVVSGPAVMRCDVLVYVVSMAVIAELATAKASGVLTDDARPTGDVDGATACSAAGEEGGRSGREGVTA
jgi:hypothetical protein